MNTTQWNTEVIIQHDFEGKKIEIVRCQVTSIHKSGWGNFYNGYIDVCGLSRSVYSTDGIRWYADFWAG